ncbi:Oidioi.mRNA.OKI2018_I69.PAR.g10571.t1.cds [Oikopleura dioica]|uniref:Oidioi.mRNA.OKI2018_I69.PAR.g10571.t1.cds n=1 Tax=Oikopleura dioica TaxID=34765 RepID=A0ABN7RUE6_OIKDI|nr:Oidioi.mRNA.OKI2018_I69.PAR.g10571.t1.cds [Oikopleura dioica]
MDFHNERAHFQEETINPRKYAFHENEGKKGFWDDAGSGFKLTQIKQPKHIYISTGEVRRSVRAAFQQQTSYTSPKEFLEARKETLKSKHLMELRKLSAVGLYREHQRTLNGKIVYEQILPENSPDEPYLIQWRGWDKWDGESICLSNYIFKGRRPNRPLYMTTEDHRWPTKISEFRWKLFDETKRGGSFVKAAWETTEKDIQGNVSTTRGNPRTEIARIAPQ